MRLLTAFHLIRGAFLAAKGATVEECARDLDCDPSSLRSQLSVYGVNFDPKPFGTRTIAVRLTRQQYELLDKEAHARGLVGGERAVMLLESALKYLLEDTHIFNNVVDDRDDRDTSGGR